MKEILELCIALDSSAADIYAVFADACPDTETQAVFLRMAQDEKAHVSWWVDLREAWSAGLLPDIADESDLLARLTELSHEIELALPITFEGLTTDQMLDLAAHLEFYMLDPAFGELLDLTGPGSSSEHRDAYSRHVMLLVNAIEQRHSRTDLSHFLARVLARTFRDQQRLVSLATHDQLTGLYNRRGFYGYVRQWTSWASRYGHAIGVILVDVDHFKRINDTFGHPAGDEALRAIAVALGDAVRTSDIIGRHGGDEFAILAPETDKDELVRLMERILDVVRETRFSVSGVPVSISVSVGGAYILGDSPATIELLTSAADHSLYEAKAAGRNRAGRPVNASAAE